MPLNIGDGWHDDNMVETIVADSFTVDICTKHGCGVISFKHEGAARPFAIAPFNAEQAAEIAIAFLRVAKVAGHA